jgi:hypothetical protein
VSTCGYVAMLLILGLVVAISGSIGAVAGLVTRPAIGAILAVLLSSALVIGGCVVLYQMTPAPPELPTMKADTGRGLAIIGAIATIMGGAASAGLAHLLGGAKTRRPSANP